ncbi:putative: hypothetical protein [Actinokineospora spheciospongiae]|uniref:WXG100 family type VII secretion target n=1 Tax=Actinokineospora spheciospongiae TaxID=909613 RepID=W7JC69_9PSEU|nr:hypothetical protein [Actinokineospora spheciospongiae]EWC63589.1 putative: hypothetical protein [Actinokineospora spheciospongiae]PWW64338.1 hypothetical protein DFQ13_103311 [Actinokineospora spheciospongiae]
MRTREPADGAAGPAGLSTDPAFGGWQSRPISAALDAGEAGLSSALPPDTRAQPSPPAPVATPTPRPSQAQGGRDGAQIRSDLSAYLDFLSALCAELGIPDPVQEYFAPVVGRWSDMHAEADRWRAVGAVAEVVTEGLTQPLGGLDAAWQGADAESFIDYVNRVGLAGHDLADAMITMGEVLDTTADGLRQVVEDMAGVLVEMAETTSQAMSGPVQGEERTRQYLDQMRRPTRELFEATRQVLEALVKLCEGVDGSQVFDKITMAHTFPEENWGITAEVPPVDVPAAVTPAAATPDPPGGGASLGSGGFGGGGGGFGGGGAGLGGGAASPATPLSAGGAATGVGEAGPGKPGGMPNGGAAPAAASAGGRGMGGMMGGMPMGGGMGAQGGNNEHKARTKVAGNPEDIFGKPGRASPSVIGDDPA